MTSSVPALMSFQPRLAFPYPNARVSWHPGHMKAFLDQMRSVLPEIDMVIEVRDARLPLTSINPHLEELTDQAWGRNWREEMKLAGRLGGIAPPKEGEGSQPGGVWRGRKRLKLVVYTKRDLAEERMEIPLVAAFAKHANQKVVFHSSGDRASAKKIVRQAKEFAKANSASLLNMKILVLGLPNVGKSSLLNALRDAGQGVKKGKAFTTSNIPGITKKFTGCVKINESPPIYAYDAPGVMPPFLGHGDEGTQAMLKIALVAGMKGNLVPDETIAEYLLHQLNLRVAETEALPPGHPGRLIPFYFGLPYSPELHSPTNDARAYLTHLARRIGAIRKANIHQGLDLERSAAFFLNHFRAGKLGRWTLDDLEQKEDLYADPEFTWQPDLQGKPSHDELLAKQHLNLLLPPPKTPISDSALFDPRSPPWAPPNPNSAENPSPADLRLTKWAPTLLPPSDLHEKVSEAVRRYYFGKEMREGQISTSQARKMRLEEMKSGAIAMRRHKTLESQRRVGLAQRPGEGAIGEGGTLRRPRVTAG